jgi:tetratricopeptide (TPR) repeat protein
MFGGDAKKSIDYLEKSKTKYESQSLTNTWEYMNVLALLGQAYHGQKAYKKAKTTYETALKAAPNFGWVKYSLLPKTEKALAQ